MKNRKTKKNKNTIKTQNSNVKPIKYDMQSLLCEYKIKSGF